MNYKNDNPNIKGNTFSKDTEFRVIKDNGVIYAQKKEEGANWENLKMYNAKTNEYKDAIFFTEVKARRFIKKIQLNQKEN